MKNLLLPVLALVLFLPQVTHAAVMSVLPPTRSAGAGDTITARISVNTEGVAINQGEATLRFPSDLLEIVSVSKTSSVFSLWVGEPSYSNAAGTLSFNAGLPTPGYSGVDGTLLTVTLRAKKAGTATVVLADAAIRANDGLGTDVLRATSPATFALTAAPPANPIPVSAPAPSAGGALTLSSNTHPDQTAWYADNDPIIDWTLPSSADAVAVLASDTQGETPSISYKASVKEKQVTDLADGTWYFNLRYRAAGVWSKVSSYRLNIDTTAPVVDTHSFVYDETSRALQVSVAATDVSSGIAGYELVIDQGEPKELSPDIFAAGPYLYSITKDGSHTVALRVIDRAGNRIDIPGSFTVPVSVLDTPVFQVGSFALTLAALLILMSFFSLASLLVAIAACYRLYQHHEKPKLQKTDTRKKVHEAFSILREDLQEHMRALQKVKDGKELTKAEAALGMGMNADLNDFEKFLNQKTDLLD